MKNQRKRETTRGKKEGKEGGRKGREGREDRRKGKELCLRKKLCMDFKMLFHQNNCF